VIGFFVRGELENLAIQVNGVFIVTDFGNYIEKELLANGVLDKQLNSRTINYFIHSFFIVTVDFLF
jgi:hypothetical protein